MNPSSERQSRLHDFPATVPHFDDKTTTRNRRASRWCSHGGGQCVLVRVPLGEAFAQDFKDGWALDVEVTKELRLKKYS